MKKSAKKIIKYIFIFSFIFILMTNSTNVLAAVNQGDTLGDLKNQLKDLKNKQQQAKNKEKQTQAEIDSNKKKMSNAEYELEQTKSEIENTKIEIEKTNEDIANVKAESEDILRLYQKLESENVYMSYITGASSMTELIMRIDAVSQLIDYNQNKLNELELLIKTNEKLTEKLNDFQVELEEKIVAYDKSIEVLGDELADLVEGAITIEQEIDALEETIKGYEKLGCKDDQEIAACINATNNNGWVKPISKGRITSLYGYRSRPTANASSFHRGVDIGIAEGTKVYAAAAGSVGAIVRKASCGGNMVYIWAYVNGKPYTYVYMHLLEINVEVGQQVNINTVIGRSGGGSTSIKRGGYDKCTTGAHLHHGLAEGGFYGTKKLPLSKFNSNTISPPGYPGLYQWFYNRY